MGSKRYFQRSNVELIAENSRLKADLLGRVERPVIAEMNTTRLGHVAQHYVNYRIARHGLQFFVPEEQQAACDLLVLGPSGRYYRCEVKGAKGKSVRLYTMRNDPKTRKLKAYCYTESDRIDFLILVDLAKELLCVLPFEVVRGKTALHLTPSGMAWAYRDRFDLFE